MTIVSTRFSTTDPYIFIVGAFEYDPERVQHWNSYLHKIEDALSTAIQHMYATYSQPVWSDLPKALGKLKFVAASTPGSCHCAVDGITVEYRYFIIQGMYNINLSYRDVALGKHDGHFYDVCFPELT